MLIIETLGDLTAVRHPRQRSITLFDSAQEAQTFIDAWYSDDVRGIGYVYVSR